MESATSETEALDWGVGGGGLEVHLEEEEEEAAKQTMVRIAMGRKDRAYSQASMIAEASREQRMRRFVMHPNSRGHTTWDVVGTVLIAYDLITIPIFMAFRPTMSDFMIGAFWLTLLFWTLDIPITFFTAIYEDGSLEFRLSRIASQYCKQWLLIDLAVVASDWVTVALGDPTEGGSQEARSVRYGKSLRAIRILRSLRLLRLAKLKRLLERLEENINSEFARIFLVVIKLLAFIVLVNHFLACAWFAIGDSEEERGWISQMGFQSRTIAYQYFTSMHWSLSQFTPASMEVVPFTVNERIFAVCVLVFAMVTFSSFISSITAAITRLRSLNNQDDLQFMTLRKFLREGQISMQLATRIMRYCEHKNHHNKLVTQDKDVSLLRLLSVPLRMELDLEVNRPLLLAHPFFLHYAHADSNALRQLCHTVLSHIQLSEGDGLFSPGLSSTKMYFVLRGVLRYQRCRRAMVHIPSQHASERDSSASLAFGLSPAAERDSHWVHERHWLCEASLWTSWVHVGSLKALTMCEVVAVDAAKFSDVTRRCHTVVALTNAYAQEFVRHLNDTPDDLLSDLDTGIAEMYTGFPRGATKEGFPMSERQVSTRTSLPY